MKLNSSDIRKMATKMIGSNKEMEKYFISKYYAKLLLNIAISFLDYKKDAVRVIVNKNNGKVAYTNGKVITISYYNDITNMFAEPSLKDLSLKGLLAHETAHILYSNFKVLKDLINTLSDGKLYCDSEITHRNKSKMIAMLNTNSIVRNAIVSTIKYINNVFEDAYIEARMIKEYPNTTAVKGIRINNIKYGSTVEYDVKSKYSTIITYLYYYLSAQKTTIPNCDDDLKECIRKCMEICKNYVFSYSPKKRSIGAILILLEVWKYYEEEVLSTLPMVDDKDLNDIKSLLDDLSELLDRFNSLTTSEGNTSDDSESMANNDNQENENEFFDGSVDIDELREKYLDENVSVTDKNSEAPSSDEPPINFADNIDFDAEIKKYAKDIVNEQQASLENDATVDATKFCEVDKIHKGIKIIYNNVPSDFEAETQYNKALKTYDIVSNAKKMSRKIENIIKAQSYDNTFKNCQTGRKICTTSLYRPDKKIFINKQVEENIGQLAVTLLVDLSGSMYGKRLHYAKLGAIQLVEFCQRINVPISVYGHNDNGNLYIYNFLNFNSPKNKKYSLMNMRAGGCNRDGLAVKFCCEQLSKREEKKMFVIISDGQPSSYGYGGFTAENDIHSIMKEYQKKGFIFVSASIGSDRENIRRIYGEKNVIDITDLSILPKTLTKVIKKQVMNL